MILTVWFLLLVSAIGIAISLLGHSLKTRVKGFLLAASSLGIVSLVLYYTQWSQVTAALY